MFCRIHIFGASGSGTSTLGLRLSDRLDARFLDNDSYYWLNTNPPFTQKRPPVERIEMIDHDVAGVRRWILSGSVCGWGDPLIDRFTLAVFLYLSPKTRMQRLADRERERYGSRIESGGDMHATHLGFMDWARNYDDGKPPIRSLELHEKWMCRLACPIIRLDSSRPVDELCDAVIERSVT